MEFIFGSLSRSVFGFGQLRGFRDMRLRVVTSMFLDCASPVGDAPPMRELSGLSKPVPSGSTSILGGGGGGKDGSRSAGEAGEDL